MATHQHVADLVGLRGIVVKHIETILQRLPRPMSAHKEFWVRAARDRARLWPGSDQIAHAMFTGRFSEAVGMYRDKSKLTS